MSNSTELLAELYSSYIPTLHRILDGAETYKEPRSQKATLCSGFILAEISFIQDGGIATRRSKTPDGVNPSLPLRTLLLPRSGSGLYPSIIQHRGGGAATKLDVINVGTPGFRQRNVEVLHLIIEEIEKITSMGITNGGDRQIV